MAQDAANTVTQRELDAPIDDSHTQPLSFPASHDPPPSPQPQTPTPASGSSQPKPCPDPSAFSDGDSASTESAAEPGGLFGTELEPVLHQACGGRLSAVRWFRTDWQRGGALTGHATYHTEDGQTRETVLKLPVPPRERYWLNQLQAHGEVVPRIYAHGEQLNGYDLAWVVMEALPHGPLGPHWQGVEFDLLTEAAARFYEAMKRSKRPTRWRIEWTATGRPCWSYRKNRCEAGRYPTPRRGRRR